MPCQSLIELLEQNPSADCQHLACLLKSKTAQSNLERSDNVSCSELFEIYTRRLAILESRDRKGNQERKIAFSSFLENLRSLNEHHCLIYCLTERDGYHWGVFVDTNHSRILGCWESPTPPVIFS